MIEVDFGFTSSYEWVPQLDCSFYSFQDSIWSAEIEMLVVWSESTHLLRGCRCATIYAYQKLLALKRFNRWDLFRTAFNDLNLGSAWLQAVNFQCRDSHRLRLEEVQYVWVRFILVVRVRYSELLLLTCRAGAISVRYLLNITRDICLIPR